MPGALQRFLQRQYAHLQLHPQEQSAFGGLRLRCCEPVKQTNAAAAEQAAWPADERPTCSLRAPSMVCSSGSTPTCAPAGMFFASHVGRSSTPGVSAFCSVQSGPSCCSACMLTCAASAFGAGRSDEAPKDELARRKMVVSSDEQHASHARLQEVAAVSPEERLVLCEQRGAG